MLLATIVIARSERNADALVGAICRWLHPAVMVLLAAFETLTHEAQAQPAVTELAGDRASEQPRSKAQQVKQWLSSMLQFHKRPR